MLDALFLSTYTLNLLFVLIKCTISLIFHTVVRKICEVSQVPSTVTTSPVVTVKNAWIAKQAQLVHVTVITLIGLYISIHLIHSVHSSVGVHNFIY